MSELKRVRLDRALYTLGSFSLLKWVTLYWLIGVICAVIVMDTMERRSIAFAVGVATDVVEGYQGVNCTFDGKHLCADKEHGLAQLNQVEFLNLLQLSEEMVWRRPSYFPSELLSHNDERYEAYLALSNQPFEFFIERELDGNLSGDSEQKKERIRILRDVKTLGKNSMDVIREELRVFFTPLPFALWLLFAVLNLVLNREYIRSRRMARNDVRCHERKMAYRYNL